jgi:hypothetical protein
MFSYSGTNPASSSSDTMDTSLNPDEAAKSIHSCNFVTRQLTPDLGRKRDWNSNPSDVFALQASKEILEENPSITAKEMEKEVQRRWENVNKTTYERAAKKRNMGELSFNSSPLKTPNAFVTVAFGTVASGPITSSTIDSGTITSAKKVTHTLSNHFD